MKRKAKNQTWNLLKKSSENVRPMPNTIKKTPRKLKSDSDDEILGFSSDSDNEIKEKLSKIVEKPLIANDEIVEFKGNQKELNSTIGSDISIDDFNEVASSAENLDKTVVYEFNESIDEFNEIITSTKKLDKTIVEEFNESIELNKSPNFEELIDELTPSQSIFVSNKTPQNVSEVNELLNESVLVKKKKKIIKGGFAERLQKLVSREKSDLAFWKHDSGNKIDSEEVIYVHALSIKSVGSVKIIICHLFDLTEVYLVMPEMTASYLKIKNETTLKITPPWKIIFCKDIGKVILVSAYKVNVFASGYPVLKTKAASELIVFSDEHQLTNNLTHQSLDEYDIVPKTSNKIGTHSSIIYAIKQKNDYVSFTARVQRILKKVISKLHPNKHTFVQRISQQREEEICQVLLVQDNNGMYAEIILPSQVFQNIIWKQAVSDGINCVYKFENLIESNLKTNIKNISATSMLKSMDILQKSNMCPESHSENYILPNLYTFKANECSTCYLLGSCDSFEVLSVPFFKVQCPLALNQDIRGSFLLKLVSITSASFNQNYKDVLKQDCCFHGYCEIKLCDTLHVIRKLSSCLVPPSLIDNVCMKDPQLKLNTHSVFFTDVFIKDNKLTADMFSTISHTQTNQNGFSKKLELVTPSLCLSVNKDDLYLIEATIIGLNGTCDVCFESNDFPKAVNRSMKCHANIKDSKMQLSVYLSSPQLAYSSIVCELLEESFTNLLSNFNNQGFEECYHSSLLGKSLGPKLVQILDIFINERGKNLILKEVIQLAS